MRTVSEIDCPQCGGSGGGEGAHTCPLCCGRARIDPRCYDEPEALDLDDRVWLVDDPDELIGLAEMMS